MPITPQPACIGAASKGSSIWYFINKFEQKIYIRQLNIPTIKAAQGSMLSQLAVTPTRPANIPKVKS